MAAGVGLVACGAPLGVADPAAPQPGPPAPLVARPLDTARPAPGPEPPVPAALDLSRKLTELSPRRALLSGHCEPVVVADEVDERPTLRVYTEDSDWRLIEDVPRTSAQLVTRSGARLLATTPRGDASDDVPSVRFRAGARMAHLDAVSSGPTIAARYDDGILEADGQLGRDDLVRVYTEDRLGALQGSPVGFDTTLDVFDAPEKGVRLATVHPPSSVKGMPPDIQRRVQPIAVALGRSDHGFSLVRLRTEDALVTGWVKAGATHPIRTQPEAPEPECYGMIGLLSEPEGPRVPLPRATLLELPATGSAVGVALRDLSAVPCVKDCDSKRPVVSFRTLTGLREFVARLPSS